MADDALRLRAEVIDKASPALMKIKKNLGEVRKLPGMEALGAQLKELQDGVEKFSKVGSLGVGAVNALGLGALTASTSLVGLISHFKTLAQQTNALREMSRETGLTVDELKQLELVGGRFGVGADQMTKGLQSFYDAMIDVRRGNSQLASELNGQGLGSFVNKLKKDNPTEALRDAFEILGSDKLMKQPMLQKRWTELFFGDGGLVSLFQDGSKGVEAAWDDIAKKLDKTNPQAIANAKKLQGALADLQAQIDNFENMAEPPIFKMLADGAENTATVIKALINVIREAHRLAKTPQTIRYGYRKHGLYSAPQSPQEGSDKLAGYAQERTDLQHRLDGERAKSRDPAMFDNLHRSDLDRIQELTNAIEQLTDQMKGGSGAKQMRFNGDGVNALRRNVAYTASTGFGIGDATPFEQAVERGVFRGLVDFSNRGDVEAAGAGGGGLQEAAYHPGGGMGRGTGGSDQSPIGRAFSRAARGFGSEDVGTPPKDVFDAISRAEGTTKQGYDTVLGYGRWGKPSKPVSQMTLNEVKAFGMQMRRAQAATGMPMGSTSSASGMFQIVGSTMMAAANALGMDPSTTVFNGDTQQKMAAWIVKHQGLGAWEGFKSHPALLAAARHALLSGTTVAAARPSLAAPKASPLANFKLPRGGSWGKDSQGNPVPIGPGGEALDPDTGRPVRVHTSLLDLARDAGIIQHKVSFDGGAHIRLELAGNRGAVRGVSTATNGMVKSIELNRGSSMMPTSDS